MPKVTPGSIPAALPTNSSSTLSPSSTTSPPPASSLAKRVSQAAGVSTGAGNSTLTTSVPRGSIPPSDPAHHAGFKEFIFRIPGAVRGFLSGICNWIVALFAKSKDKPQAAAVGKPQETADELKLKTRGERIAAMKEQISTTRQADTCLQAVLDFLAESNEGKHLDSEGLFRISAADSEKPSFVRDMLEKLKSGQPLDFNEDNPSAHLVANILNEFIASREFFFDPEAKQAFLEVGKEGLSSQEQTAALKAAVGKLSDEKKDILFKIIAIFTLVADHSAKNLMGVSNLAIVLAPNIVPATTIEESFQASRACEAILKNWMKLGEM